MPTSIISTALPSMTAFVEARGGAIVPKKLPAIDLNWKEQRYVELELKAYRFGLSQDEQDELDELGADLNENAGLAAWMECERRGVA